MFAFLVNASLRGRALVLAVAVVVLAYGGSLLPQMRIDVLPDLNKGIVTVITEAPGQSPEEVEVAISYRVEMAVNGASGVTRVRSVSSTGLSVVYVEFDWDSDVYRNRQVVTERLSQIQTELPPGVKPILAPVSSQLGEILLIGISGDRTDPMVLREIGDWVVAPRLRSVPGVSRVVPIGGLVRQFRVAPDVVRMAQLGISLDELESALAQYGSNTGGGVVNQNDQEFLIRNVSRTLDLEDLRNLVVDLRDGQPILLRQFAEVSFEPKQRRGDAGIMGSPGVIVSVQKQPTADTVALTSQIMSVLADLQATMPEGVRVDETLFRQADFISTSVDNMKHVLVEAIAAVAVILFLFLLNVRTTLISLVAIPVSVLMTFIVFRWIGYSINTMTLGGLAIAIGELVDDAVVDVENIYRRLKENRKASRPRPALRVIAEASQEIRSGIVYSTLIIVLVFVPLFAIPGIEGRLFAPLGIAYIVSILASLITSITLTPVLCSFLLPQAKRLGEHESFLLRFLKRINGATISFVLDRPSPVIAGVGLAVAAAIMVVPTLPRAFLPPFNEGALVVTMVLDPGIALSESSHIAQVAERVLLGVPDVRRVARRTGRSEADEHAMGVNVTEFEVILEPTRPRTLDQITKSIRGRLGVIPGTFSITQPINMRLNESVLTGSTADIVIKIFGDDLDTLRTIAGEVQGQLARVAGVADAAVEAQMPVPQLLVQVDPRRALLYGLKPGDLSRTLAHMTNGIVVAQAIDGIRRFDVVIRLPEWQRTTAELGALMIETPAGDVPLSQVATVTETNGPNEVLRENGQRRILVTANGDGTNGNMIPREVARIMTEVAVPTGYFIAFEGVYAEGSRSTLRLAGLGLVSLMLIFAILFTRYRSPVLALIIMGNVPLALIGSVIAMKVTGVDLSVASMIGFITLTGIITRNGILKISHYINLVLHEGESFGSRLILRGSQERLAPVLMTATSAGVALIPLLLGGHDAGKEILHPVAVVIFGGLISATLLDALVTPLLFHRFGLKPLQRLVATQVGGRPAEAY